MDKFIVSARKYRPQNFSTVVGQSHITTTLKNAIKNNQLAHAFLFCGPRGVGKTTCARILAKTINCENRTADAEACNTCSSCLSFENGTSLNIHELDAASNNSVEDIRMLSENVRFAPQAGKYKVYIIDEVHMLSQSAFNAFLKTLEEPPPFAIFILATTEKHKILPTILSRCQIFDFKRITNNDTTEHLEEICKKEHITADEAALHIIAQKSEGCMRDALSILDKIVSFTNGKITYSNTLEHLNILDEDYYFRLTDAMRKQMASDAILLFDEINLKGFEGDLVLNGFAEFIRNLLVSKNKKVASLLEVPEGFKKRYEETALTIDDAWLISALNILAESEINYRIAKNKRLHVELTLIKLCYLQQALSPETEDPVALKKKQPDNLKPVSFKAITPVLKRERQETLPASEQKKKEAPPVKEETGAKLIIENPAPPEKKADTPADDTALKAAVPFSRIRSLEEIRKKVASDHAEADAIELKEEELYVAWGSYIEQLLKNKNHSAILHFKNARLYIADNNTIEIFTDNNLQQKFIEAERAALVSHLQHYFNNRYLTYRLILEEKDKEPSPVKEYLNPKQQYLRIIEAYPLVKKLKDAIGLELDY